MLPTLNEKNLYFLLTLYFVYFFLIRVKIAIIFACIGCLYASIPDHKYGYHVHTIHTEPHGKHYGDIGHYGGALIHTGGHGGYAGVVHGVSHGHDDHTDYYVS